MKESATELDNSSPEQVSQPAATDDVKRVSENRCSRTYLMADVEGKILLDDLTEIVIFDDECRFTVDRS